jgi:hypothetical protein
MNGTSTFAASWDSIVAVMSKLGASAADAMLIVQGFAYLAGIVFLGMGIVMMTKAVNPQARTAYNGSAWFWSMLIGVLLFTLPETMSVISNTLLDGVATNSSPLAYSQYIQGGNLAVGSCKLGGLRPLFVLFGFIAVIRGMLVFRTVGMYGNYSRGNATVARGFVLCTAGVMLVHMQEMLSLINQVTGLQLGAGLC